MLKRISTIMLCAFMTMVFCQTSLFAETLTPELCKEKAIKAAKLLETEGDAALAKIKDPNGEFRFGGAEGYVWVHNLEGIMLMHPTKPALDGQMILKQTDANGVLLFAKMNELVGKSNAGWVAYMWTKPGEPKASPKVSYVVLAKNGGKNYVAGSGVYDVTATDVKTKFPSDPIAE